MTVIVKTVSERVAEYRKELDQRSGVLSIDERMALIDSYEKKLIDEALSPLRSMAAKRQAEQEAEQRAREAERDARDAALREAKMAALKLDLERSWLANGGEPKTFEAAWPELQREHLSKAALGGRDEAREQHARRIHDNF